jgi:hypothetical protein
MTNLKQEAIRRMKKLNIWDQVIRDYEESDKIYKSEFQGVIYDLTEEELSLVRKFEQKHKEYGTKVYHVIKENTTEGVGYIYFYVSKEDVKDDAKKYFDRNIESNIVYIYFDAADSSWFSEFGTDYFEPWFGGLHCANVTSQEDFNKLSKFR